MSKYLDFQELVPSGRKTKIISVLSKNNVLLGDISFWPAWRKYVFNPASGTMFDDKCLKEIVNKLDEMNIEIRQEWANRRNSRIKKSQIYWLYKLFQNPLANPVKNSTITGTEIEMLKIMKEIF